MSSNQPANHTQNTQVNVAMNGQQAQPAQPQPTQGQPLPQEQAVPQQQTPQQGPPNQPSAQPAPAPAPAAVRTKKRIGDILIDNNWITSEQLKTALSESKATGLPLGAVLIKLNFCDEKTLGMALAKLHGLEYVDTSDLMLDEETLKLLPTDFIRQHMVIPLRVDEKYKRLEVIMARPDNLQVLDEVALITGYRPIAKVSTHKELLNLLDRFFSNYASTDDALAKLAEEIASEDSMYGGAVGIDAELEAELNENDAPIIQLVNSVLLEAIEKDASDIHVEPQKERLLVRFRIDGILKEMQSIPKKMSQAIVSRIKVASGMDIAEKRKPQDGRMKIKFGSQEVDMRVNTIALQFGEKICIRLLKPTNTTGGMASLGFKEDEMARITKMIKAPNGIILVTGPTGSGKTTTLYSCVREINTPEINISTVEDPIEYPLAGINQTQVNHKAGLSFALCLRALLRQDPDVIMIGEIRDEETLEAAIHAALTGHLVFSTLHTNSTAKTVTRLLDMGAPPYLVSSSVIGILAQRLVRRICSECKEAYTPSVDELNTLGLSDHPVEDMKLFRGAGCDKCEGSGYSGRVGLYEIMEISRDIAQMIDAQDSTFTIEDKAVSEGMNTLAMDGKRKVLEGLTTLSEVTRLLGLDLEG